ncbi:NAD(P)-binding protein [Thozetella sp. PMI_491]|nr:NAD(P)-binding protein [Thozetella sp. PMI_491]
MARFFITGSSDGIGLLTAKRLIAQGHEVVLHARNSQRAADTVAACPEAKDVLIADLTSLEETKTLAAEANQHGPFAAVLHNAGVYLGMEKVPGKSGLPSLFAVNTLAPYMLACLMDKPERLVFVSSGMHFGGRANLKSPAALQASGYSDSKLHNVMLAKAFSRRWPGVPANVVDPGWVPTKMGGRSAPQSLDSAVDAFVMQALGNGAASGKTATYFRQSKAEASNEAALDVAQQDKLMKMLEDISGVSCPE